MTNVNQPRIFSEEEILELMRLRIHPLLGTRCEENKTFVPEIESLAINQQPDFFNIPERISFKHHVQPILERLCEKECIDDRYLNQKMLMKMSIVPDKLDANAYPYTMLRKNVYNSILMCGKTLPAFYTHVLSNWAKGDFINDY